MGTKQEPKYTEQNKTQMKMIRQTRTETTQRDTGEDNDRRRETLGQGKTQNNMGHGCGRDNTFLVSYLT